MGHTVSLNVVESLSIYVIINQINVMAYKLIVLVLLEVLT